MSLACGGEDRVACPSCSVESPPPPDRSPGPALDPGSDIETGVRTALLRRPMMEMGGGRDGDRKLTLEV